MFASRRLDTFGTGDFTALRAKAIAAARAKKTIDNILSELATIIRHWHRQQDLPPFRVGLLKVEGRRPGWYT